MSAKNMLVAAPVAALLCGAMAGAALASGGGGGGSGFGGGGFGSAPSNSAPAYNAVEEYQKGVAALKDGDYREADRAFSHVIEVAPKDSTTLFAMGLAKAGEKDLRGAAKFYDRALKADPQHIGARRELAVTEAQLGQTDKAKTELATLQTRATACGDACPDADQLKASVAAVQAAVAPAAPSATPGATPSATGTPGPAAALTRPDLMFAKAEAGDHNYIDAVHLINQHRYAEALARLKAAQSAFGPHPDILTYIGYVNRKMGHLVAAESYYRQALAIYPDHVGATEYYGELKVIKGDIAGARQMLAKLQQNCTFGCVEEEDLRRWIVTGHDPS
jgi:Tfp pilus assembly protein PilF